MYFKVLLIAVGFTLLQHSLRLVQLMGYHYVVFDHAPGPCFTLDSIVGGSMDVEMLPGGLTFISSNRPDLWQGEGRGRLYQYDLTHHEGAPHELTLEEDFYTDDFRPHGLAAWRDNDTAEVTLFVINHHKDGERVEKFTLEQNTSLLVHQGSIIDNAFRSINQIAALSSDTFYITNMFHSKTRSGTLLEFIMMFAWGNLIYYDGSKSHVITRSFIPTGLALSNNKSLLFLSVAGMQEVRVYQRRPDNKIDYLKSLRIEAYLSDLHIDPMTGDLWLAAASSASESHLHDTHPNLPCGSRVLHLHADMMGNLTNLREAYANSGSQLSCASSVAHYNGNLIIGSPYKPPLICQVTAL